jgi:FkbM family methyltransferase
MYIKNIARKFVPTSIKDLIPTYKHRVIKRLFYLPISDTGVSEEGIPFVRLENGLIFYGYQPTRLQRYIYKYFLDHKIKAILSEEAFAVALDILIRYVEPESGSDYIKSGKYYNLEEGNTVVECGAYIGYYAMRVAEMVGESGCVVAIEPVAENLRRLSMNVEKNSFSNVIVVSKAVWKEKTVQNLFIEVKQRASLINKMVKSNESVSIECDTIDNILEDLDINQVDFVRIQVNGAEVEALTGMTETLKKGPKLLVASPYQRDKLLLYEKVISILHKAGYSIIKEGESIFAWKD